MMESLVAIGSNQPFDGASPCQIVSRAIARFPFFQMQVRRVSRFFATPAFPPGSGPEFVNAAAVVTSDLPPERVLAALHEIEAEFGRHRRYRWSARTLDLDLIATADRVLPDPAVQDAWRALSVEDQQTQAPESMILPHPRLQDRGFVLVPLTDVAPDWRHPRLGRSIAEMTAALPAKERATIRPL